MYRGDFFLGIKWKTTNPLKQTRLFLNEKCAEHLYFSWGFAIIMLNVNMLILKSDKPDQQCSLKYRHKLFKIIV